jgi:hypothetical protein
LLYSPTAPDIYFSDANRVAAQSRFNTHIDSIIRTLNPMKINSIT